MRRPIIHCTTTSRKLAVIGTGTRSIKDSIDLVPAERALGIGGQQIAVPAVDAKDKAEPILPVLAEAGPTDCTSEQHLVALESGFLANFSSDAGHHIFAGLEFSTQSVVFSQMQIA